MARRSRRRVAHSASPGRTKHIQTLWVPRPLAPAPPPPPPAPPASPPAAGGAGEAAARPPRACLCDCPGLVPPASGVGRAALVCSGVLSLHHVRTLGVAGGGPAGPGSPVQLVCDRVPREVVESLYGVRVPSVRERRARAPTLGEGPSAGRLAALRGVAMSSAVRFWPRGPGRGVGNDGVRGVAWG